jgi:chromosome segregation ATPase
MRKTEPVAYTCGDINELKNILTTISEEMNRVRAKLDDENTDLSDILFHWENSLKRIRDFELEDLRKANGALRDWGSELYDEAETLEEERDELSKKCAKLESTIEDLNNELLEAQELNERLC